MVTYGGCPIILLVCSYFSLSPYKLYLATLPVEISLKMLLMMHHRSPLLLHLATLPLEITYKILILTNRESNLLLVVPFLWCFFFMVFNTMYTYMSIVPLCFSAPSQRYDYVRVHVGNFLDIHFIAFNPTVPSILVYTYQRA